MNIPRSLKAILAASVCLLPLQALADDFDVADKPAAAAPTTNNWISLGGNYQSGRSYYLNRYRGRPDAGFNGLGEFYLSGGDAWDSGGTFYYEAEGSDLGYDDRAASLKLGQRGTWGLSLSYDGIPYEGMANYRSLWDGSGRPGAIGTTLGGAGGTIANSNITFRQIAPAVTSLGSPYIGTVAGPAIWQPTFTRQPALFNFNIGTQRDVFQGTGKWQWNDWTITGTMRHEHKTGYQVNSAAVTGTASPVTSSAAAPTTFTSALGYFAQPIDYDTDRYDIVAARATPRLQYQVGYSFSNFTDNLQTINLQNPYSFTGATFGATNAGSPMFAPYVLPPSNSAHQVKLMAGYNITPTTRLTGNFAWGLQLQNAAYQLASGNPNLGNLSEPRSSLGGIVEVWHGNVALTAQPLHNFDLRVAYSIDNRDNQTPRNSYLDDHNTTATATTRLNNMPSSYQHQTMVAEAGYRLLPQTKISVSDTLEITNRNFATSNAVTTNTAMAKIRSQVFDQVFGSLSYSHQDRSAYNYLNNNSWILLNEAARDPGALPGQTFQMFFEASRKRDEVKATLDVSPFNNLTASLFTRYANDTYPNTVYGLRNNQNLSIGPDVNWQPAADVNVHGFYTYQQLFYQLNSIYESSTTAAPTATSFQVPWTQKTTDSVHTAGVTVDWQAIKDVLKFSFDYNFAYGDTAYAMGDSVVFFGASVAGSQITRNTINLQPLPDVQSMLHMIQLRGEYTFRPNMTLMFGYAFERFNYKDFLNGQSPTAYASVVVPGFNNNNESVHIIGAGMRIKF